MSGLETLIWFVLGVFTLGVSIVLYVIIIAFKEFIRLIQEDPRDSD